jgi:hypothetical protein
MQTRGLSLGLTLREVKNKACNLIDAEVPDTLLPGLWLKEPPKSALTSQVLPAFGHNSVKNPFPRQNTAHHPRTNKVLIVISTTGPSSGAGVAP